MKYAKALSSRVNGPAYTVDQINQVCIYGVVATDNKLVNFYSAIAKSKQIN